MALFNIRLACTVDRMERKVIWVKREGVPSVERCRRLAGHTTVLHRMPRQPNDGRRVINVPAHLEGMPPNGGHLRIEHPSTTN